MPWRIAAVLPLLASFAFLAPASARAQTAIKEISGKEISSKETSKETKDAASDRDSTGDDDAVTGKVTQVFRDTKRANVQFPKNSHVASGSAVTISNAAGEACEGRIVSASGRKAMAEFEGCSAFADFKAGSTVAVSTLEAPRAAVPAPQPEAHAWPTGDSPAERQAQEAARRPSRLRFSLMGLLDTASSIRFESAKVSTTSATYNGTVEYKMDGAAGIAAEMLMADEHRWGFQAGLSYEAPRKFRSVDISLKDFLGTTYSGSFTTNDATLELVTLYGNALYRWGTFYLPFGLNVTQPMLRSAPPALADVSTSVGLQFGGGWFIGDNFAIEAMIRASYLNARSTTTSSGTQVDLGNGSIPSLNLRLKWIL